ncbi:MAG: cell division topological specificity factor MinE [Fusobacteriaceae bacterium]
MGMFNLLFKKDKSKNIAKDRLKLVLIHDRAIIPEEIMTKMRDEIIQIISKYVVIDSGEFNIEISNLAETDRKTALVVNIPIKSLKK